MSQANSEHWRPVVGYEGSYEVSDRGRVRSIARAIRYPKGGLRELPTRILSQRLRGRARSLYPVVELARDNRKLLFKVHILVLEAFVGPRPENFVACHANDEPTDNRLANLRWDTCSANTCDSIANGSHFQARKTVCQQGHGYTAANTYMRPKGGRGCRACRRQAAAKHRMAKV